MASNAKDVELMLKNTTLFAPSICSDQDLYNAISSGDLEQVKKLNCGKNRFNQLIDKDSIINYSTLVFGYRDFDYSVLPGSTFFYYACRSSSPAIVKYMIDKGADLELANTKLYDRPIQIALISRRPDIVEELAKAGADINITDGDGFSLLHTAVSVFSGTNLIELLLNAGIDSTLKCGGKTAADFAMKNKQFDKAEFIFDNTDPILHPSIMSEENMNILLNRRGTCCPCAIQ